jgi:hypothetical protein
MEWLDVAEKEIRKNVWVGDYIFFKILSLNFPGGTEENHKTISVRKVGVPISIRTGYFPNIIKKRYCLRQFTQSFLQSDFQSVIFQIPYLQLIFIFFIVSHNTSSLPNVWLGMNANREYFPRSPCVYVRLISLAVILQTSEPRYAIL